MHTRHTHTRIHTHASKQLFNNDEFFNGDLSRERQMASIPQVSHQLMQLLLERWTSNDNSYSNCSSNIANNVSQLIRYKTLLNIIGETQLGSETF